MDDRELIEQPEHPPLTLEHQLHEPADATTIDAPAPIALLERFHSIDTLRGIAVLGILPMNILTGFALPAAAFMNPTIAGGFEGSNFYVWLTTHLLLDMKMMTIFSMLFGAGVLVMSDRAVARGGSSLAIYYRRTAWLALIGFLHAYLFWFGDILFIYALCGLLLYPIRSLKPLPLIAIGFAITLVGGLIFFSLGALLDYLRVNDPKSWENAWSGMKEGFDPSSDQLAQETVARTESLAGLFRWNAIQALGMHLALMPFFALWRVLGAMIIGMGLMKLGTFTASRSARFYLWLGIAGYLLGFALIIPGVRGTLATDFDPIHFMMWGMNANYLGSIFVAIGHVAVVMLVCKSGLLSGAQRVLARTGQMALTNYLAQTAICLFIFSAWGLALFDRFDRTQLMLIVAGIWTLQLIWSPIWLAHFRFGPAEWVWRSLTYGRLQSMRAIA